MRLWLVSCFKQGDLGISILEMLQVLIVCVLFLGAALRSPAAPLQLNQLRAGSLSFSNVTVIGANATDLYFTHDHGISNVKLKYLDPELQKRFHYDPRDAAAAEKEQEHEDSRYKGEIAANLAARMAAAARSTNGAATSADAPADPFSDKALIGKPGPPMEFEKWSGTKPQLKDKFVLVCFWEDWSLAAKKFLPQFTAYQKQFTNNFQVVGVVTREPPSSANATNSLDFPIAIDSEGKFAARVGAVSIPYVVLTNPKSKVLYAGHPAALNDKILQALLAAKE
jgi:hypothetical protein